MSNSTIKVRLESEKVDIRKPMREEVYAITYNMSKPQSLMSALLKQSLVFSVLFYGLSSFCRKILA